MSRRSLLPSAVSNGSSSDASSFSKLSSTRNSLVPLRQPLSSLSAQTQATSHAAQQPINNKRLSMAHSTNNNAEQQAEQRPLKLARTSLAPVALAQQQQQQQVQPVQQPQPTEINADNRPGYNVRMLVGRGGEELCFEEVRALHGRYALSKKSSSSSSSLRESLLQTATVSLPPMQPPVATPTSSPTNLSASFTPDASSASSALQHHASPTVCTRAAMQDIEAMFKDSAHSPITPAGHRDHQQSFSSAASCAVPFSARSLTTEIGGGGNMGAAGGDNRGRPSPVAFTVFTDEELVTRNIQQQMQQSMQAAATAQAQQQQQQATAAAAQEKKQRRPLAPREDVIVTNENINNNCNSNSDEENDCVSAYSNTGKSYPPLTPILELSTESDMSHASNTSTNMGMGANNNSMQQQQQIIVCADEEEEEGAAGASAANNAASSSSSSSAAPSPSDSTIDPFDPVQRDSWIVELDVLRSHSSSGLLTDLSSQAAPFSLDALTSGTETSLEIGEKLLQITSIVSTARSADSTEQNIVLMAENLLEGGENEVRIVSRAQGLLEFHFTSTWQARMRANSATLSAEEAKLMESSLLFATECVVYSDYAVLISPISSALSGGSLESLLQLYSKNGSSMDDKLVAFYTVELLKLLHLLHSSSLLHNNLHSRHLFLRFSDAAQKGGVWSENWHANGEGGWEHKGLSLGGWSSTVDRSLFPAETSFKSDSSAYKEAFNPLLTYTQDTLGHASWTEQIDLFSLCSTVHQMLFGPAVEMECVLDEAGSITLARPLSTEFARTTFLPFFETILNFQFEVNRPQATIELLTLLQQHFEMAMGMEVNGTVVNTQIKNLLCKQQMMCLQKKK